MKTKWIILIQRTPANRTEPKAWSYSFDFILLEGIKIPETETQALLWCDYFIRFSEYFIV